MKRTSSSDQLARREVAGFRIAPFLKILLALLTKPGLRLTPLYSVNLRVPSPVRQCFGVRVTNVGKEPIVVSGIAAATRDRSVEYLFASRNLPKRLEPNESVDEPFNLALGLPADTETLYACDSSGREWRLPKRLLKELLQHHAQASADWCCW